MSHEPSDRRRDVRNVAAALTVAVIGVGLVCALAVNLLKSPTFDDTVGRIAALGGSFGGVAVAVIVVWLLVSFALVGFVARASVRREAGTLGIWLEAARDTFWAATAILLLGMLPVLVLSLTAHGSDRPFSMLLEPAVLGATALVAGATATVLTIVVLAR